MRNRNRHTVFILTGSAFPDIGYQLGEAALAITWCDDFGFYTLNPDLRIAKHSGKFQLISNSRHLHLEEWLKEHNATLDIRFTSNKVYYHLNDDDLASLAYLVFK